MTADIGSREMPVPSRIILDLPDWLSALGESKMQIPELSERMTFVIGLAQRNIEHKTGGPFAAAIFTANDHRLVAVGLNRVEPLNCSVAHAEIMAFMLAQQRLGSFDLGRDPAVPHELVSSAQPCAMCAGATLWAGVTRLVYGATAGDVEGILGFDEGPLPREWLFEFKRRGIEILPEYCRTEARTVLRNYSQMRGTIYNSRQGFVT